jgi:hypothetical protein
MFCKKTWYFKGCIMFSKSEIILKRPIVIEIIASKIAKSAFYFKRQLLMQLKAKISASHLTMSSYLLRRYL